MKSIAGAVIAILLSSLLAVGSLGIGHYQREVARAEEALALSDPAAAAAIYARLEKTVAAVEKIPWVFDAVRADLQVRRSRVAYWQGNYAAILKEAAAAEEQGKAVVPALRLIRANARFRLAAGERDREKVIQALGECIRDYAKIVEAEPAFTDAAFNYEYLLMLRSDVASGHRAVSSGRHGIRQPDPAQGMHGEEGGEPKAKEGAKMKVIVPKEGDEDPQKRGQEPSRGAATKKRG
jgi:hypothetical protein